MVNFNFFFQDYLHSHGLLSVKLKKITNISLKLKLSPVVSRGESYSNGLLFVAFLDYSCVGVIKRVSSLPTYEQCSLHFPSLHGLDDNVSGNCLERCKLASKQLS